MFRLPLALAIASAAFAAAPLYRIDGRFTPASPARVFLHGVGNSLARETVTLVPGQFHFKNVPAGSYTLLVYVRGGRAASRTIDVGPATGGKGRRVALTLNFSPSDFVADAVDSPYVASVAQLAIPAKALREYENAQKDLAKPNVDSAVKRLERAVEMAPQFAAAWNNLGTIAYHRRNFERAEECFRKALAADPQAFDPLVNLGGVLLVTGKLDAAIDANVHAVAARPNDALAQSQLGMSYFQAGNLDLAVKHLERARQIDPGHFSSPQLPLAEIHLRRGEKRQAADVLEDFLKHHPDYAEAAKMREAIVKLRQ